MRLLGRATEHYTNTLFTFNLGCMFTVISFVTSKKLIFAEINFCVDNFRDFHDFLVIMRKFVRVTFVLLSFPWK